MIPLCIPNISANEGKYLQECIDTNFVSSVGKFVGQFEDLISNKTHSKYTVVTNTGTSALHLALTTIGVTHNDLVVLPSFTFIASANAISHCGAAPLLVDIDEESWTICPKSLNSLLEKETKFDSQENLIHKPSQKIIKAIMPVFTLGTPADMDAINKIAKKYKIPVVADGAAAIGATYKNKNLGEIADLTCFSFNGNKTITTGGGGAIISNNEELMKKAKHLCTTARVGTNYDHDMVGFNYRLTNLQAAVGCAQIEVLDNFLTKKREISKTYENAFSDNVACRPFPKPEWANSACWFSGVQLKDSYNKLTVEQIVKKLEEQGIQARSFWKPIHLQKPYANSPKGDLTKSEHIWDKVITLPCSTNLSENDQLFVIEKLKEILSI
tara:strand:+ start:151465 stop:152616 length:1152 start_codon:yes stop_codon:yes gene_type:complete